MQMTGLSDLDNGGIGAREHARERHLGCWLQPVLLVVNCLGWGTDHMKGVREPRIRACLPLGLMQDAAVNYHQVTCDRQINSLIVTIRFAAENTETYLARMFRECNLLSPEVGHR